jgi:hypothetical protein
MTDGARVAAVRAFDFTERQARFLVLVLEHCGVCLPPAFARLTAAWRFGPQAPVPGVCRRGPRPADASVSRQADHWRVRDDRPVSASAGGTQLPSPVQAVVPRAG